MRGYPAWGRIPQTADELHAALLDMGIKPPREAQDWIKRREPETDKLRQDFFKHNQLLLGFTSPPIAEINIGLHSVHNRAALIHAWLEEMPLAFGDLLTKYGDPNGLAKFGFGGEKDILGLPLRPAPAMDKPSEASTSDPR